MVMISDIKAVFETVVPTINNNLFYACVTGSFLHGTFTSTSDIDIKVVTVPSLNDLITQKPVDIHKKEYSVFINGIDRNVEITFIPIQLWLRKLVSMEINSVEIFFTIGTEYELFSLSGAHQLKENKNKLLTYNQVKSFGGFSLSCTKEKNKFIGKSLSHALRILDTAEELILTHNICYPNKNSAEYLRLKQKKNDFSDTEKQQQVDNIKDRAEKLLNGGSVVSDTKDNLMYVDDFLQELYKNLYRL